MSQYVTTHNASGKAIFSPKIPAEPHQIDISHGTSQNVLQIVYSSNTFVPDVSTESDIDEFNKVRIEGMPGGGLIPPNGTATSIFTLGPGSGSPWHRTLTLDTLIVIEGTVELYLDGGETRTLNVGDTVVQRGTMHKWKNVTPDGGRARILGTAQPVQQPILIGEQKLETEWRI